MNRKEMQEKIGELQRSLSALNLAFHTQQEAHEELKKEHRRKLKMIEARADLKDYIILCDYLPENAPELIKEVFKFYGFLDERRLRPKEQLWIAKDKGEIDEKV